MASPAPAHAARGEYGGERTLHVVSSLASSTGAAVRGVRAARCDGGIGAIGIGAPSQLVDIGDAVAVTIGAIVIERSE
jgi:hypothetical protein